MKTQKGVTLVSLIVYVIAMTIAVTTLSVISSYFYKNIDTTNKNINPLTEYTTFNSFFTEEINHDSIKVLECKENYIVFDDEVQYTFVPENRGIYRNKVKICHNVESCSFSYTQRNGKNVVTVNMKIENGDEKNVEYTIKNW